MRPVKAAATLTLLLVAVATPARAQFSILPSIPGLAGGGGALTGFYAPNAPFIAGLDQPLYAVINGGDFGDLYPGWEILPENSTDMAKDVTTRTLAVYETAVSDAQAQAQELAGEDFTNIETESLESAAIAPGFIVSDPGVQAAVIANTEAVLALVQELQLLRQAVNTLVTVEATEHAQQLSATAQQRATEAVSPILQGP